MGFLQPCGASINIPIFEVKENEAEKEIAGNSWFSGGKWEEGGETEAQSRNSCSDVRCAMLFFTALSRGKDWNLHHLTSQILGLMSAHLILGKWKNDLILHRSGWGTGTIHSSSSSQESGCLPRREERQLVRRGNLLRSQHCCACCAGSLQPKQTFRAQNRAPKMLLCH